MYLYISFVRWIRKTILTAENSFPEMLTRQRVVGSFELEESPLDVALGLIRNRNALLVSCFVLYYCLASLCLSATSRFVRYDYDQREELDMSPANPKTLQAALQGSLLLQGREALENKI